MANILVIDDEPILLDLISSALRLDGHRVIARRGPVPALAVQRSAQAGGQPQVELVVTEIGTKPISGFDLVRRLSTMGFKGPVLFTSAYPGLCAAVSAGLEQAVLVKPFTAPVLLAAVTRALERSKPKICRAAI